MSRKKRKRSPLALIFTLAVMVLILGAAVVLYNRTSLNKTEMNKMDYYGLEKEDQAAAIVNDVVLEDKGIVRNGKVYLPYSMVWGSLNSAFYWEEDTGSLLLTLPEGTSSWKPDDGSGAVLLEGQTPYISAECVKENSDIDMAVLQEPWRVTARTKWSGLSVEKVTADTQVRYRGGPKAEILTYVKAGDLVVLLERAGDWYKVSTTDGYLGYVKDTYLEEADSEDELLATDRQLRSDRDEVDRTRTDQDAIPVLCMGFYGGFAGDPEELAEQYELLLSTYSQQDRYLILGCYPNVWEDKEAYDSALEEAFGDHYVSLNRTVTNKLMTEDGRREMAQVIYARLENLGYLGNE